jgi:protein-L-isoaspartate O-methyltransferase
MNSVINDMLVPKARRSVHQVLLKWFEAQERGTVLDIPAGFGYLSYKLREIGFTPVCAEIQPEIVRDKEKRRKSNPFYCHLFGLLD